MWSYFQWHDVQTEFNENSSSDSKFIHGYDGDKNTLFLEKGSNLKEMFMLK
jgi:hypothetical protein